MKITRNMLVQAKACPAQLAIFDAEWPEGAEVTLANVQRADELHLDLSWFAYNYFTANALCAFEEAMGAAHAAYNEATAPEQGIYDKTVAIVWERHSDTYGAELAQAAAAYNAATVAALAAFNNARAAAFFETFELKGVGQDEDHA